MSEQAKRKAICYHVSTEQVTNTANFNWHPWIDDGGDIELLRGMVVNKYIRECLCGIEKARIYLYEASDKTYPSGRPMSVTLTIYNIKKQVA